MTNEKIELAKRDVKKFLEKNHIAVLSTCSNNTPHTTTVYYCMLPNFVFYFYTKSVTTKAKNIRNNPNVSLTIGTGPLHIYVNILGKASEVKEEDEKNQVFEKLINISVQNGVKMWPSDDIKHFRGEDNAIFKIVPEKMTYLNLDSTEYAESISEEFVQILP